MRPTDAKAFYAYALMPQDPRYVGPRPPFPLQKQSPPGSTFSLDPQPDHGEASYQGSNRFLGCAVVVTGGDSGIGRAVALAFAREGADVLISYLSEEEDARDTAKWVEQAGRRAVLVPGDISAETHCEKIIDMAVKEFGRIDVLVNNAGFQRTHESLEDFSAEEVPHTFGANIESMFYLSKAAAARMRHGGAIINTASIQADNPSPQLLAYAATKGAIINFTSALAQLLAPQGIRVNAVAPGPVWTPLIPATIPAEKAAKFGGNTPLGRPGQPAELAPAYVFWRPSKRAISPALCCRSPAVVRCFSALSKTLTGAYLREHMRTAIMKPLSNINIGVRRQLAVSITQILRGAFLLCMRFLNYRF